jgi:hypothetical protein
LVASAGTGFFPSPASRPGPKQEKQLIRVPDSAPSLPHRKKQARNARGGQSGRRTGRGSLPDRRRSLLVEDGSSPQSKARLDFWAGGGELGAGIGGGRKLQEGGEEEHEAGRGRVRSKSQLCLSLGASDQRRDLLGHIRFPLLPAGRPAPATSSFEFSASSSAVSNRD